jgi:hypothetical protein
VPNQSRRLFDGDKDQSDTSQRDVDALEDIREYTQIKHIARRTIIDRFDLRTICSPTQLGLVEKLIL